MARFVYFIILFLAVSITSNSFALPYQSSQLIKTKADSLSISGIQAFKKGEYNKATEFYQKALEIYKSIKEDEEAAKVLANIGMVCTKQGNFSKALRYQLSAAPIFAKEDDKQSLVRTFNAIANIYRKLQDFDKSLEFHFKSIRIKEELKDDKGLGVSYMNVGNVYRDMKRYPEALKYYNKSLVIKNKYEDNKSISLLLDNIGVLYFELGKYPDAEVHFLNSLEIMSKIEDKNGMGTLANDLGRLYTTLGRFDLAEKYLSKGFEVAIEMNSKNLLLDYYEIQKLLNFKQNRFLQSLHYDSLFDATKDSIFNEEKSKIQTEMQVKYETDLKDQKIDLLGEQKKTQEIQLQLVQSKMNLFTVIFYGGLFLAIVISTALWKLYSVKKRSEHQKEMMMREMHHRVKNNLQLILSMFSLQANHLKNKDEKEVVIEMENRVKAMMMVHQQLYKGAFSETIRMDEFIKDLAHNIARSYRFNPNDLALNLEELEMDTNKAISVGLVVNELLVNAMKYGVKGGGKVIVCLVEENNKWVVEIKDSGDGIPNTQEESPHDSFGLFLVKSLSSQLNAVLQMKNENGALINLQIPKA